MARDEKGTQKKRIDLQEYEISAVFNIKVCSHDDRYSIEVLVPSLFEDQTASWDRIVNGVDTFVTESMQTKEEEDIPSGKPIAKARPRQKPTVTLAPVSILMNEDSETWKHNDQTIVGVLKCQKP